MPEQAGDELADQLRVRLFEDQLFEEDRVDARVAREQEMRTVAVVRREVRGSRGLADAVQHVAQVATTSAKRRAP